MSDPRHNENLRYNALVVDPDARTRMLLKHATSSVITFGLVNLYQNLFSALEKLDGDERCDVIFVSYKFQQDEIRDFIQRAKEHPQGQDAAYILVAKPEEQDSTTVADKVMMGTDGFLFEPYSVDSLIEITKLASRVRKERSGSRQIAALEFVINEFMNHLNLIAYSKSMGIDVGRALRKLREMSQFLYALDDESRQIYYQLIIDTLVNTSVPTRIFQRKKYTGASTLVRKKMEQKLLEDLEKSLAKIEGKQSTIVGHS